MSTLSVTKTLTNEGWSVSANLLAGATIPLEIFMYENTGTTTLGNWVGVMVGTDVARIQIWTGSIIPIFGNKYVRYGQANFVVDFSDDPDLIISKLVDSVNSFSQQFQAITPVTTTYVIT